MASRLPGKVAAPVEEVGKGLLPGGMPGLANVGFLITVAQIASTPFAPEWFARPVGSSAVLSGRYMVKIQNPARPAAIVRGFALGQEGRVAVAETRTLELTWQEPNWVATTDDWKLVLNRIFGLVLLEGYGHQYAPVYPADYIGHIDPFVGTGRTPRVGT